MNSDLDLEGINLTLRASPRAKRLRLRVDPRTGAVLLTVPKRTSQKQAIAWAAGHREWIQARVAEIPPAEAIVPGGSITYRGERLAIDWQAGLPRQVRPSPDRLTVGGPLDTLEGRIVRWLKTEAKTLLAAETTELAAKAGARLTRVGVGDPVSRWGSCSSSGAIRYSWRLIMAPDFVRRATVAHEVAHLVHLNHGPEFHRLVEVLLGTDPKPARAWLRRDGATLHRLGRHPWPRS